MQAAVTTRMLTRRYGDRIAVNHVDLDVPAGTVFGFLGPNGAGKTTTLRMILGLTHPDRGAITIFGQSMPDARLAILRQIGALIETPALYDHLSGRDNLNITSHIIGADKAAIERGLALVGLTAAADRRVGGYSLGMRQRLAIARALLGRPKLLILDEPNNGLDPEGMDEMRELLRDLPAASGATVIISSHMLDEVERTVSHVALMRDGRLIAQGPLRAILADKGAGTLMIEVDRPEAAARLIGERGLTASVSGSRIAITDGGADPAAINIMLTGAGLNVSHLSVQKRNLAQAYERLSREPLSCAA